MGVYKVTYYNVIDRTNWPKGPWDSEPDKEQWVDKETCYPCIILRHDVSGHLCGYVGIDKAHPMYKKMYIDFEEDLDAHGGITYTELLSDDMRPNPLNTSLLADSETSVNSNSLWWIGFDCAHLGDLEPNNRWNKPATMYKYKETYKDWDYVKNQCEQLALQLYRAEQNSRVTSKDELNEDRLREFLMDIFINRVPSKDRRIAYSTWCRTVDGWVMHTPEDFNYCSNPDCSPCSMFHEMLEKEAKSFISVTDKNFIDGKENNKDIPKTGWEGIQGGT